MWCKVRAGQRDDTRWCAHQYDKVTHTHTHTYIHTNIHRHTQHTQTYTHTHIDTHTQHAQHINSHTQHTEHSKPIKTDTFTNTDTVLS